ncbi:RNA-binding protein MEX3B [Lingula anatina]|uniref:RNA-binding protein MEX3B n=1 Tax=Lingula anatina TaxID=7574 RepID=A0A1S3H4C1_LINAN|nr:RNA-binding protein MEX3B [Lingula anatina]|eukprot:XP_013380853.1 RNA-binding protein MEX3B [Lingula anatina]
MTSSHHIAPVFEQEEAEFNSRAVAARPNVYKRLKGYIFIDFSSICSPEMPASLLTDVSTNGGGLEDQRALQIALELSMLGINDGGLNSPFDENKGSRKSANVTESVPVPSSEHVAEIVGRQGCKIKALRAKTNTYIKTPVRGEEPVFVVTGRKEDVEAAKREILSAGEHFSQIRASRRNNSNGNVTTGTGTPTPPGPPSPTTPGQVTIQVRVPYRVVGLVVGPKGATIKRIQQQTHTYIVTPSRDKEPIFEVTGLPENVEKAKKEIESHIAMRTGGVPMDPTNDENDFHTNGIDSGFHEMNDFAAFYKHHPNSAFSSYTSSNNLQNEQEGSIFSFPPPPINGTTSTTSKLNEFNLNGFGCNGFTNGLTNIYDNDEGFGSPSFDPVPLPASIWPDLGEPSAPLFGKTSPSASLPHRSSSVSGVVTPRLSPTLTDSSSPEQHQSVRRMRSDPLNGGLAAMPNFAPLPTNGFPATSSSSISSATSTSPVDTNALPRRSCFVCSDSDVVAALVPCGHNLFCMECANLIVEKPDTKRRCPICQQVPTQAIRIIS